jgi:hypothetical protein
LGSQHWWFKNLYFRVFWLKARCKVTIKNLFYPGFLRKSGFLLWVKKAAKNESEYEEKNPVSAT